MNHSLVSFDTISLNNIYYSKEIGYFNQDNEIIIDNFDFVKKKFNSQIFTKHLKNPVIIVDAINSNYSHAVFDSCFRLFWIIEEIRNYLKNTKSFSHVDLIFRARDFELFPKENLINIDKINKQYIGIYHELLNTLPINEVYFEQLISKSEILKIENLFVTSYGNERHERTPWNDHKVYFDRSINTSKNRFEDSEIKIMLNKYSNNVISQNNININKVENNTLLLIDRRAKKRNLKFYLFLLKFFLMLKNIKYDGPFYFEDYSLVEQIELLNNYQFVLIEHGAGLANIIWLPNKFYIELYSVKNRETAYKHICKLTNNMIYQTNKSKLLFRILFDNILDKNMYSN